MPVSTHGIFNSFLPFSKEKSELVFLLHGISIERLFPLKPPVENRLIFFLTNPRRNGPMIRTSRAEDTKDNWAVD